MNSITTRVMVVLLIEACLLFTTVLGGCRASRGNYRTFRRDLFAILPGKGMKNGDAVR